jgi:hypothetical protein
MVHSVQDTRALWEKSLPSLIPLVFCPVLILAPIDSRFFSCDGLICLLGSILSLHLFRRPSPCIYSSRLKLKHVLLLQFFSPTAPDCTTGVFVQRCDHCPSRPHLGDDCQFPMTISPKDPQPFTIYICPYPFTDGRSLPYRVSRRCLHTYFIATVSSISSVTLKALTCQYPQLLSCATRRSGARLLFPMLGRA